MKIKFLSDPHADINTWRLDSLLKDCSSDYDVALIAGDLAGDQEDIRGFLETYFPDKKVYFVRGNHCGVYSDTNYHKRVPISKIFKDMRKEFSKKHKNWHLLDDDYVSLGDGLYVIGATLYTDYCVYGKALKEIHMSIGERYLNDFRLGYVEADKGSGFSVRHLRASDLLKMHKKSKRKIKQLHDKIVAEDPNAKIILLTHHCLSEKCISHAFKTSKGNASYVSNLEDWVVEKLPNVCMIHSGHVHHCDLFEFGPEDHRVQYVINSIGYLQYGEGSEYKKDLIMEL